MFKIDARGANMQENCTASRFGFPIGRPKISCKHLEGSGIGRVEAHRRPCTLVGILFCRLGGKY